MGFTHLATGERNQFPSPVAWYFEEAQKMALSLLTCHNGVLEICEVLKLEDQGFEYQEKIALDWTLTNFI